MANDLDLRVRLLGDSSDLDEATRDGEESVSRLTTVMAGLGVAGAAGGAALSVGFAQALDLEEGRARLQAQLGVTEEQAAAAGEFAGSIYADNFGSSMEEVNDAIVSIKQNLGKFEQVGTESFKNVTEAALTIADVFEVDVAESSQAAAALVKNGLAKNSAEAFDIIAAGFQGGTDKAGDFLDTLTEYSPQFAKLGFDGAESMALLRAGIQAGARDTDVIADAFKEFSLRAIDGSKGTIEGYKALGLSAKETAADIAAGGDRAQESTQEVLKRLAAMRDPIEQNAAGVALFGTQWEDTLRQIIKPMAAADLGAASLAGTVDDMTATMGSTGKARIETLRREFEAWVQSAIQGSGVSGTVIAAFGSFGPAALTAAGSLGAMVSGIAALNVGSALARAGQIAASVATGVWTGAQWLLNAALTANPTGLVIVGVAALIAIFVIAYRRSDTFRAFVQRLWLALRVGAAAAWSALKAFGARFASWVKGVVDRAGRVVQWFRDLPGKVRGSLGDLGSLLTRAGRSIIDGLLRGITERFAAVRAKLNELTGMLPDWKGPARVDATILYGSGALVAGGFEAGFVDRFRAVKSTMGAETAALGGISRARPLGVAPGGGDVVHLHVGTMITDDRQLMQRIEQARRATSRSRTVARSVVARVGA